ncbi:carbon-nitrogen hydrolase family protein [Thalassomonas sp. M1454]|uniref:carbon-nitrogen hydrolase family protein n=1 Tax=Thalassomonas sp. M1454 TaxID=2594477 RepID=UPI00163DD32E|nr:carbon-nitrogen hydrolase family protein [Thalassomonas sp. M1454]
MNKLRVAVLQFASTLNVEENLDTCLRMLAKGAEVKPNLMVMPEFCNALSWYENQEHAWQLALDLDGEFLNAIAKSAKKFNSYVVINVSLRRTYPDITVTSCLFSPEGELLVTADKQTLMGHENDFFVRASTESPVIATKYGKLGIFPCRDGVTFETPRSLALRGAQLFCDSLNSFAIDEASLHVPARAPENKVFLAAANKVGPLIPEEILSDVAQATNIPEKFLMGAGESQIVDPNGKVLAKAPANTEAVVYADIDLSLANSKRRPDGTDLFANRRPELYQQIAADAAQVDCSGGANTVDVSLFQGVDTADSDELIYGENQIEQVVKYVKSQAAKLIVLPELFFAKNAQVGNIKTAESLSQQAITSIADALNKEQVIATSIVIEETLVAVLISQEGILFSQPLLHFCQRHGWSNHGAELRTFDSPLGRIALLTGDDASYPEIVKVAALKGVHILVCPIDIQEPWEAQYGLLSRAAENRICVVSSSRTKHFDDVEYAGVIATLERDFTILTPWQERKFDGYINNPLVTQQVSHSTLATIHPHAATNKLMSANTDLLAHRPWQPTATLVKALEAENTEIGLSHYG